MPAWLLRPRYVGVGALTFIVLDGGVRGACLYAQAYPWCETSGLLAWIALAGLAGSTILWTMGWPRAPYPDTFLARQARVALAFLSFCAGYGILTTVCRHALTP
ncbi:MAG TPA: hypothetical protein VGR62_26180 [Candidatus Binatia bacterium]|nr:hypothetical protein [Candidatus Binatia bacterium]